MHKTKLAVVTTMHNAGQHVADSIVSVLDQTYKDFVYLLVDDGSTDNTAQIAQEFAHRDPRVHFIGIKHSGIAEAANTGCRQAAAEYIARLDADDIAIGDRFERQLDILEKRKDVVMVGGAMQPISRDGVQLGVRHYPASSAQIRATLKTANCICHSTVMMRRITLERAGWYRRYFEPSEDYDLWLRISALGDIVNLPTVLVKYRIHVQQASFRMIEQQALGALAARVSHSRHVRGIQNVSHEPAALASIASMRAEGVDHTEIVREIMCHYDQAINIAKELSENRVDSVNEALFSLITRRDDLAAMGETATVSPI